MQNITITLTFDELIVFLAIIGFTTMNGLEEISLAGLSEQEIADMLERGKQSLIDRGLLVLDSEDSVTLDDRRLVALVGSSVVPDATLLLARVDPDGATEAYYFDATPELLVEHFVPSPGMYQFEYMPDIEALKQRVQAILSSSQSQSREAQEEEKAFDIPASKIASFLETCRKGEIEQATGMLSDQGVAPELASSLARDCGDNPMWMGIVTWGLRRGRPEGGNALMAFSKEEYHWLVESVYDESMARARRVSDHVCEEAFISLLEPLSRVWHPAD